MSTLVTFDQMVALRELERARMKREGVGYGPEFQAFLDRLKSGGVSPAAAQPHGGKRRKGPQLPPRDPRIIQQAKRLWNKGWPTRMRGELGNPKYPTFASYLASIPNLPTFPEGYDARFPHLVLVDRRIQVVETRALLNVLFDGANDTFVPFGPTQVPAALVYWIRVQDGKAYRNRKPTVCRTEFASHGDEVGLEAHEGLALYAQSPDLLELGYAIDLPASVHAGVRGFCAYLKRWSDDDVKLDWRWYGNAHPLFGSASRGECVA